MRGVVFRLDFQNEGMTHQLPWHRGEGSAHLMIAVIINIPFKGTEHDYT